MAKPEHILVFRFSALGDVAMAVPVVKLLLLQYPHLLITFASIPFHQPLFENIERLHFYPVDLKRDFIGLKGLIRLARRIKKDIPFDAIADLHDVLRTKVIRNLLGKKIAVIDKGRSEKRELTRKRNKKRRQLKTSHQRYADVFEKLGYPVSLNIEDGVLSKSKDESLLPVSHQGNKLIGLAPFAKHDAKMYPLEKMRQVVELLKQEPSVHLFLFGSKAESILMKEWISNSPNIHLMAGKYSFEQELKVISQMDAMISMDSANMHLASLFGVPVVSVWGGTHPFLGFYGWGQKMENVVQSDLPCRPSSVFGKKDCPVHGKNGCMQEVTAEMIVKRVTDILSAQ
ncbi:MAG: glycosyltransferase family 9 protein [Sphingobacteriales bacterium]|jgi:ADP-heptose:LPS heptosyltransferase|nr:glycosyltransferase family 9 protein [Sphingobacteriales bacterium]